jgi:hypothetical protein
MSNQNKFSATQIRYPWIVILITFMVFPPAGLYTFHSRSNTIKKASPDAYKKVLLFSAGLSLLSVIGSSGFYFYDQTFLFQWCIFLFLVSLIILVYSLHLRQNSLLFQKYNPIFVEDKIHDLEKIAEMTNQPYLKVQKDLVKLIVNDYYPQGRINRNTKTIHFPEIDAAFQSVI